MNKQTKQLYNQAWERWGFSEQSLIVAEEFSELIKELSKYNRDIGNEKNILQEVADCEIMIEQIKTKFNFSEKKITKIKKIKLEKLRKFLGLLGKMEEYDWHFTKKKRQSKMGMSFKEYLGKKHNGNYPMFKAICDGQEKYLYSDEELNSLIKQQQKVKGKEVEVEDVDVAKGEVDKDSIERLEFPESREIENTVRMIEKEGFRAEDFFKGQENGEPPRANLIYDDTRLDIYSLSELLPKIKEIGKKGLDIQRYKGLGEMNAEELAVTTMNSESRTLLRVKIEDGLKADEIFSILSGKDVKQRREYIETHALEVRNLDV